MTGTMYKLITVNTSSVSTTRHPQHNTRPVCLCTGHFYIIFSLNNIGENILDDLYLLSAPVVKPASDSVCVHVCVSEGTGTLLRLRVLPSGARQVPEERILPEGQCQAAFQPRCP